MDSVLNMHVIHPTFVCLQMYVVSLRDKRDFLNKIVNVLIENLLTTGLNDSTQV